MTKAGAAFALAALGSMALPTAHAMTGIDDIPRHAQLTHEVDVGNFMTVHCVSETVGQITCTIAQAQLRKSEVPTRADIEERLAAEPFDKAAMCKDGARMAEFAGLDDEAMVAQLVQAAEEKGEPVHPHHVHPVVLDQSRVVIGAMASFCEGRSTPVDLAATMAAAEARECRIMVYPPETMHFTYDAAAEAWTSVEATLEGCAARNITVLRQEAPYGGDFKTWRYEQQRVIGNPSGTTSLGQSCAEWADDGLAVWAWEPKPRAVQCDFIGTQ